MVSYSIFLCSLLSGFGIVFAESCKNAPAPVPYLQGGPVEDSQDLNSSSFIGTPANKKTLKPRYKFFPEASLLHTNGGNTGSSDYPGPLGINSNISSSTNSINILVWGADGSLTCGYANASAGNPPPRGLVAVDPTSFDILAAWYPPTNGTIGFAYMEYLEKTNDVLLSTKEGTVYIVRRKKCKGVPYFTTIRTIALASILQPGETMLNTMLDTAGNIWFSSGGILGTGDYQQNSTTFGYITPKGKIIKQHLENEMVENGIAVSGMDVYMSTGPSGAANHSNATGHMYSLTADGCEGIKIRWRVPYDAGSGKPDIVTSRGSGSTPALLADQYVAITDKADPQIHVNIYHQAPKGTKEQQLVCQIPLFTPGRSNNDNAIITHFDGKSHGLVIQNDFGSPPLYMGQSNTSFWAIDGKWNDMSVMAGGMARVDVDAHGNCTLRWTSDVAVKAVSVLSTKTGLVYSYVQDTKRSSDGEYAWYIAGIDWDTGKTIYQVRTGTGGRFNDNWGEGTVGPDGTFYQAVLNGVVAVKDGKQAYHFTS